jgi:predicted secreted protein
MATNAGIGYGTLFQIRTSTGPDVWTTIGEQTNITPPSISADAIDATHSESPSGRREFIPGLVDEGEVSFEINYQPGAASFATLLGYLRSTVVARVIFPNGAKWQFSGILTGVEPEAPVDDKMVASVTFKLTGASELQAAAAPANLVLPAISGVLAVGEVLTAYEGVWSNGPTSYAYEWQNAGVAINGATARTYTVVAGDAGDSITVVVTATNSAGSDDAESAAVVIGA